METGVGGLEPKEASQVMIKEMKRYVDKGTTLKQIILIGFTKGLTQAFQSALKTDIP